MIKQVNKVGCGTLANENGVLINPTDIPTELIIGKVKVEVQDE